MFLPDSVLLSFEEVLEDDKALRVVIKIRTARKIKHPLAFGKEGSYSVLLGQKHGFKLSSFAKFYITTHLEP